MSFKNVKLERMNKLQCRTQKAACGRKGFPNIFEFIRFFLTTQLNSVLLWLNPTTVYMLVSAKEPMMTV